MSQIEELEEYVKATFIGVETKVEPPLHANGIWSLDIIDGDYQFVIEDYGDFFLFEQVTEGSMPFSKPEEQYDSLHEMKARLDKVLAW